jgi:hypothetical protein
MGPSGLPLGQARAFAFRLDDLAGKTRCQRSAGKRFRMYAPSSLLCCIVII